MHDVTVPWTVAKMNGLSCRSNHLCLCMQLLLLWMFVCVLTLLTKSAHPSLWTGASVWSLAHTSILTLEPTHSCTNTTWLVQWWNWHNLKSRNCTQCHFPTEFQNATKRHAVFKELDVRCSDRCETALIWVNFCKYSNHPSQRLQDQKRGSQKRGSEGLTAKYKVKTLTCKKLKLYLPNHSCLIEKSDIHTKAHLYNLCETTLLFNGYYKINSGPAFVNLAF